MALQIESSLPPTVAQQVFIIGSGIAGALTGLVIARGFAGIKEVPTPLVVATTVVSIFFTVGAGLYLAKKAKEGVYARTR